MKSKTWPITLLLIATTNSIADVPDWSSESTLPGQEICSEHNGHTVCLRDQNRANIYQESLAQWERDRHMGSKHALFYPVTVTQLVIPEDSVERFFNEETNSPIRRLVYRAAKAITKFKSFQEVFSWLGLNDYPKTEEELGPNLIAPMGSDIENRPMGVTTRRLHGAQVTTFSCAACHSADLFGVKVLGMTNRFPRANEFFHIGKKLLANTPSLAFRAVFNPSPEDLYIYKRAKKAIDFVEVVKPLTLGLDTSLAQVALSLSRRGADGYAKKIPLRAMFPRPSRLRKVPADSKPAVWWNLKYKTRWLSDGSIVSGNPIHTNFLWNEIGRGVDLRELEQWLVENKQTVKELTSYVFSTTAPRYNDFFPGDIDIIRAKRGEKLFLKNCSGCHGQYDKGWSSNNAETYQEKIATTKVWYHKKTPVIDVGTDPYRREGMKYFYKELNRLKISKTIGAVVQPQKGYVPPPLVGIWARWPYFHNNSAPTLYDVITPAGKRPVTYVAVPAQDKEIDFDRLKNGYPSSYRVRLPYREDKNYFFDSRKKGLSNMGHTKMLLDRQGKEKFSETQKYDLIEFLKTL